jgi:hypothetical protein
MVLGSTQPLTEMSTGTFLGVKGGQRVRFTSPPSVGCLDKYGSLAASQPYGPLSHVGGIALSFTTQTKHFYRTVPLVGNPRVISNITDYLWQNKINSDVTWQYGTEGFTARPFSTEIILISYCGFLGWGIVYSAREVPSFAATWHIYLHWNWHCAL